MIGANITPEQLALYIEAQALLVKAQGMEQENRRAVAIGDFPPYGFDEFRKIADKLDEIAEDIEDEDEPLSNVNRPGIAALFVGLAITALMVLLLGKP